MVKWTVVKDPKARDKRFEGMRLEWANLDTKNKLEDRIFWLFIRAAVRGRDGIGLYGYSTDFTPELSIDVRMDYTDGWGGDIRYRPWNAREKDLVRRFELGLLEVD